MDAEMQLTLLKFDLQITTDKLDPYLSALLEGAATEIRREGIPLSDTLEDGLLVIQYAAYLYRKRREQDTAMPQFLRWMLNNRKVQREATPDG